MLLVHACCADCALKLLESIKEEGKYRSDEISLYFYNPNIHPQEEYLSRHRAIKQIAQIQKVNCIIANWSPTEYFNQLKDHFKSSQFQDFADKNRRCPVCWKLRLLQTFKYASLNGFNQVTSTLLSSKYQSVDIIKKIASELSDTYNLEFIIPVNINYELHTAGFYKQNYCGCIFSLQERYEEKYLKK